MKKWLIGVVILVIFSSGYAYYDDNQTICEAGGFDWLTGDINYPATYSFTVDSVGGNPSGWSVTEGSAGNSEVINYYNGHSKVWLIESTGGGGGVNLEAYDFLAGYETKGVIEYWFNTANEGALLRLWEDSTAVMPALAVQSGELQYYNSGWQKLADITLNQWYHLKMNFSLSDGIDIYLNNEKLINDMAWKTTPSSGVNKIEIGQDDAQVREIYFDAVGYSWDPDYELGDNTLAPCCGDDNETFFNNTHLCYNGEFSQESDYNMGFCLVQGYAWMEGITGFNATYTFDDTTCGLPEGWSIIGPKTNYNITVIPELSGRKNVLMIDDNDNSNTKNNRVQADFSGTTDGYIQFWFRTTDASKRRDIALTDGQGSWHLKFYLEDNTFYNSGNFAGVIGGDIQSNTWYKIKIDFRKSDCTWDLYIDDELIKKDINWFYDFCFTLRKMYMHTDTTSTGFTDYFDDITLSWQNPDISSCCGDDGVSDNFYNGSMIGQSSFFCHEGVITESVIDSNKTICESWGFDWITDTTTGDYPNCCGDDYKNDYFYNSTRTCYNGLYDSNTYDNNQVSCEGGGYTWFTGTIKGDYGPCCGDDGILDDFYNNSVDSNDFFCQDGLVIEEEVDINQTLCEQWCGVWASDGWGVNSKCCGDDDRNDYFFNGDKNLQEVCYYGVYYYDALDNSESDCEASGNKWLLNSNYPATYSFDNDEVGSIPEGWTDSSYSGYTRGIISDYKNHNKVLYGYDQSWGYGLSFRQFFDSPQSYGSVELYWLATSVSDYSPQIYLAGSSGNLLGIDVYYSRYRRLGTEIPGTLGLPTSNTWHHMRLDFESTTNNYMGLEKGEWRVFFDGLEYGPYDLTHNESVTYLKLDSYYRSDNVGVYFDAIGYSWDEDYEMGDNTIASCCGDDSTNDTFYNGSAHNTTSMCLNGFFSEGDSFDTNQTLCESFDYTWITSATSGDFPNCCGDDTSNDNFENDTFICINGSAFLKGGLSPAGCATNHVDSNENYVLDSGDSCGLGTCSDYYAIDEGIDYVWDGYCYSGALNTSCISGSLPPFNTSFTVTVTGNLTEIGTDLPVIGEIIMINANGADYEDVTDEWGGWEVIVSYWEMDCATSNLATASFVKDDKEYTTSRSFTAII